MEGCNASPNKETSCKKTILSDLEEECCMPSNSHSSDIKVFEKECDYIQSLDKDRENGNNRLELLEDDSSIFVFKTGSVQKACDAQENSDLLKSMQENDIAAQELENTQASQHIITHLPNPTVDDKHLTEGSKSGAEKMSQSISAVSVTKIKSSDDGREYNNSMEMIKESYSHSIDDSCGKIDERGVSSFEKVKVTDRNSNNSSQFCSLNLNQTNSCGGNEVIKDSHPHGFQKSDDPNEPVENPEKVVLNEGKTIKSMQDDDHKEKIDSYENKRIDMIKDPDKMDLFKFQGSESFCEPYYKTSISKNIEQPYESHSDPALIRKLDPFRLSSDEDFSPKAYKPIKRKLSRRLIDFKSQGLDLFEEFVVEQDRENGVEEKRQKLTENDSEIPLQKSIHVVYVYSKDLVEKANNLIRIEGRANLVHSLIEVYGILQHVDVIPPRLATESEIVGFHCPMYIDFLKGLSECEDPSDSIVAEAEAYGLSYDCPLQEEVFETAALIGGGTITAAESLISGTANIAVNWCGGWHHAKRDSASGFCYINDIVLGILKLREKFERVLYVDLDLHHGDGVEEAFSMTPKVMTVSFHKYACGFFPGSGSIEDVGSGRGRFYTVNVPLLDGISDGPFFSIFTSVMKKVREKFNGEALVIQCGADSLSEDPMASFNLTHVAIAKCVCFLLTWNLPTLLLGGGGYNFPNTAKCWTFLTAMAAGKKLPTDIPEHEHLLEYGPSYELSTSQGNRKDCNTKEHMEKIISTIFKNLNSL